METAKRKFGACDMPCVPVWSMVPYLGQLAITLYGWMLSSQNG